MKTSLLLLIAWSAATVLATAAEIVESKVTLALKYYLNDETAQVTEDTFTENYRTFALKNSDVIAWIGKASNRTYSKRAYIVQRLTFPQPGAEASYFIVDGDNRTNITAYIDFNGTVFATKQKRKIADYSGTAKYLKHGDLSLIVPVNGGFPADAFSLYSLSLYEQAVKAFIKDETLVTFSTIKFPISGYGRFYGPPLQRWIDAGVSGSMKIQGAKIVP